MSDWIQTTLGDICHVYQPQTLAQKELRSGRYPVFGANGQIGWHDEFNHETSQLVLGCRGSVGSVHVTPDCSWINGNAMVVTPLHGVIDRDFLAYALRGGIDVSASVTGAAQPQITRASLSPLRISYPGSVVEQRRIVTILDEAFEGIATAKAHAEQNLQSAADVLNQHLLGVFATSEGAIFPVASLARCSLGKMLDKAKNRGDFKPYLRNLNVRWFGFDLDDVLEMRFTEDEVHKYTVRKGDLVICEGGYPGRCAVWEQDEPVYIQKALHRARFVEPVHARWVQYYLYAQDISGGLKQYFTGSGIQHFTGAALAKLMVPIPEVHLVRQHVELFDQLRADCERLQAVYQRKLTALTELQQSLLHQAFTGQL